MSDKLHSINIGKKIQQFRNESNIKQEVFAKDLNVSKSALSLYENKKRQITVDTFIDILKVFRKYNQIHVISELLDCIIKEVFYDIVIELEERIDFNMNKLKEKIDEFENKGYSKLEDVECIADIFLPSCLTRYPEYYVKNFKNIDGDDVGVYFMYHDLGELIGIFKDRENKIFISKEKFEYELKRENENIIKYNGDIPSEELFKLDTLIILFSNIEDLKKLDDIFDENTIKIIKEEFNEFVSLFEN